MTEAEWSGSLDPAQMLETLRGLRVHVRKGGRRKLRLFGCACVRRAWRLLDGTGRGWVELAERIADGAAPLPRGELIEQPGRDFGVAGGHSAADWAKAAAYLTLARDVMEAANVGRSSAIALGVEVLRPGVDQGSARRWAEGEMLAQSALARDVFGNPFRPARLDAVTPIVRPLAVAAYDERVLPSGELDPVRLAVLADALEEAGADGDILAHLRYAGPHVRGCWAVDLALGRE